MLFVFVFVFLTSEYTWFHCTMQFVSFTLSLLTLNTFYTISVCFFHSLFPSLQHSLYHGSLSLLLSFLPPNTSSSFRFDSRVIAAPAIVFRGASGKEDEEGTGREASVGEEVAGGASRSILVAGHSLEINANSDIDLHLSLPQVALLQDIVQDTTR